MTTNPTLADVTPPPSPEVARQLLGLLGRPGSAAAPAASTG